MNLKNFTRFVMCTIIAVLAIPGVILLFIDLAWLAALWFLADGCLSLWEKFRGRFIDSKDKTYARYIHSNRS